MLIKPVCDKIRAILSNASTNLSSLLNWQRVVGPLYTAPCTNSTFPSFAMSNVQNARRREIDLQSAIAAAAVASKCTMYNARRRPRFSKRQPTHYLGYRHGYATRLGLMLRTVHTQATQCRICVACAIELKAGRRRLSKSTRYANQSTVRVPFALVNTWSIESNRFAIRGECW